MTSLVISLLACLPFSIGDYIKSTNLELLNLEIVKADLPAEVPESLRSHFDRETFRVLDSDSRWLSFWFRKHIPVQANEVQIKNGLTYREIPEGTLVALIRIEKPFIDYRKQSVPPGLYSLRFFIQPDVGDHIGTAPHPEFLLLVPLAKEESIEPLDFPSLRKLSSTVADTDHPSVMLLWPDQTKGTVIRIEKRESDCQAFRIPRAVQTDGSVTKLTFVINVFGNSPTRATAVR